MTAEAGVAVERVAAVERATCEIPGCIGPVEYRGSGRPPKYCGEVVGGVPHNRLTAFRIANGQITWPLGPAANTPGADSDEVGNHRPVSAARLTVQALLQDFHALAAGHEDRMAALADRIKAAVATAGDPDAAAAEVTAAHRDARALVDTAESERDAAQARARAAEREVGIAAAGRRAAEDAAEQALAELEDAQEQAAAIEQARAGHQARAEQLIGELADVAGARDRLTVELVEAGAERDRLAVDLADALTAADRMGAELAAARTANVTLTADRERLTRDVSEARSAADVLRLRAEQSERDLARAETAAGQARELLQETRTALVEAAARTEQQATRLAAAREQLAETRGQLDGARAAVVEEKAHSVRRLADQREVYEAQLLVLRAQLDRAAGDESASSRASRGGCRAQSEPTGPPRSRGSDGAPWDDKKR